MGRPGNEKLAELFARLAQGDDEALDEIARGWSDVLGSYAFALVGNEADAEDALMDALLGLLRSRHRLSRVRHPMAYLLSAVRRAALRYRSSHHAQGDPAVGRNAAIGANHASDDLAMSLCVRDAVMALQPDQREVVVLHVYAGLTFAEIARLLNMSANTAASRWRYACEKLRAALGDDVDAR